MGRNQPKLTQSYTIASSACYWSSFSKHLGFLAGMGFGINHSSISKDTVYFNTPQFDKRYEYYNYLYFSPEFKFRFTLKNQQHDYDFLVKGLILDIGARYNFPLVFKHVGRFAGNTKMIERGLHQYSDLRVFASIGSAPALVFLNTVRLIYPGQLPRIAKIHDWIENGFTWLTICPTL